MASYYCLTCVPDFAPQLQLRCHADAICRFAEPGPPGFYSISPPPGLQQQRMGTAFPEWRGSASLGEQAHTHFKSPAAATATAIAAETTTATGLTRGRWVA
jgi:hypothetical protein